MCCGGGGGGQRPLEAEEKELLRMQARAAEQGIQGRDEATATYRSMGQRGRELGSTENLRRAGEQVVQEGLTAAGTTNRMRAAQLQGMGVNPGDPRFGNALIASGVDQAAQIAGAANTGRNQQREMGLKLEGAGAAGLAGFDPTGALSSMSSTIGNAQRTAAQADAADAQGWSNLASAGMYGLRNAKEIGEGAKTVMGWFGSDGGEVPDYAAGGIVREMGYAAGGNVYDTVNQQTQRVRQQVANRGVEPQKPGVDPALAMDAARFVVDKVGAKSLGTGLKAAPGAGTQLAAPSGGVGLQLPGATSGVGLQAPASALAPNLGGSIAADAAAAGLGEAAVGAGLGEAAAGAAAAEAAAATGAAGAAGAGAGMAALGTAIPILGIGAALASLFSDDFANGGSVKPGIGRNSRTPGGRAMNAGGGKVRGPGGPKDDKVPAWLSPGEFVMPVEAVRKYGIDRLEKMRQSALKERGMQQ